MDAQTMLTLLPKTRVRLPDGGEGSIENPRYIVAKGNWTVDVAGQAFDGVGGYPFERLS